MAKGKYEVIVKGMTVFGAFYGDVIELDEEVAKRFVDGRYIKVSRKKEVDAKVEPTPIEAVTPKKETPKQTAPKKNATKSDKK